MRFALLRGGPGSRNPPPIHKLLMRCNPAQSVRFGDKRLCGPHPLRKGAGPDPNLHMMHVLVAELTPQADLGSQHVLLVLVGLYHSADVLVVEVQPGLVVAVGNPQIIAYSHVEIEWAVLGNDELVFCGR